MTAEQKYAEAVAALTHRLGTWGVEDPADKARAFMHDLAQHGWRAERPPVAPPADGRPARPEVRQAAIAAARASLGRHPEPSTPDTTSSTDTEEQDA